MLYSLLDDDERNKITSGEYSKELSPRSSATFGNYSPSQPLQNLSSKMTFHEKDAQDSLDSKDYKSSLEKKHRHILNLEIPLDSVEKDASQSTKPNYKIEILQTQQHENASGSGGNKKQMENIYLRKAEGGKEYEFAPIYSKSPDLNKQNEQKEPIGVGIQGEKNKDIDHYIMSEMYDYEDNPYNILNELNEESGVKPAYNYMSLHPSSKKNISSPPLSLSHLTPMTNQDQDQSSANPANKTDSPIKIVQNERENAMQFLNQKNEPPEQMKRDITFDYKDILIEEDIRQFWNKYFRHDRIVHVDVFISCLFEEYKHIIQDPYNIHQQNLIADELRARVTYDDKTVSLTALHHFTFNASITLFKSSILGLEQRLNEIAQKVLKESLINTNQNVSQFPISNPRQDTLKRELNQEIMGELAGVQDMLATKKKALAKKEKTLKSKEIAIAHQKR